MFIFQNKSIQNEKSKLSEITQFIFSKKLFIQKKYSQFTFTLFPTFERQFEIINSMISILYKKNKNSNVLMIRGIVEAGSIFLLSLSSYSMMFLISLCNILACTFMMVSGLFSGFLRILTASS